MDRDSALTAYVYYIKHQAGRNVLTQNIIPQIRQLMRMIFSFKGYVFTNL